MQLEDFARLGRLHPLALHLPIGFLLSALVLEVLATRQKLARTALGGFLWLAALSAVLAASTGWVLSHEDGYGGETLARHERLGIALAVAAVLAAMLHDRSERSAVRLGLYRAALVVACVLLVFAGHLGSTLTHGEDWLDGPRARTRPVVVAPVDGSLSDDVVWDSSGLADSSPDGAAAASPSAEPETYATAIAPLLAERCGSCHGAKKHKGGLRLDSPEAMLAGGDSGPALVPGDAASSLLVQRTALPLDHEDHMPPEGKPQPSPEELAELTAWIAGGAPFGSARAESASPSPTGAVRTPEPARPGEPARSVEPAAPPAAALAALEAAFLHHEPLADGALRVDVAAVAQDFGDAELARLLVPLAPWIHELVLARSRVGDASVAELARFPALRRLDLRATGVSTTGLAALAGNETLAELNLAQTALDDGVVETLLGLPALERLELWKAGLSPAALERLRARPGLRVNAGDEPPAEVLASEGELAFSSDRPLPGAELVPDALRPVNATCPVSGSPVNPKYAAVFTSASGTKIVGFCCPNCPKEFWADPAKFESKLP
jgi:uncharacterized membrane protein